MQAHIPTGLRGPEGRKLLSFSGTYYVFNNYSDKVLDDTNASKSDGNHMQQFHLNGNTAQQWAFVQLRDGNYLIVTQRSGKALDVVDSSKDDGASIDQMHVDGGLEPGVALVQLSNGNYVILNANSGKALDNGANTGDHGVIDQWSYVEAPNQEWRLEQA